ncbi:MAG: molybdopterin-dependent oxidoreductase [Nitrososphaerales archaeon]
MSEDSRPFTLSRREFLSIISSTAISTILISYLPEEVLSFRYIAPLEPTLNPLLTYPNRDWEKVYRDLYTPDESFVYLCAPNDTHGCLLKANVKNGVVIYADPSFGYGKAIDIYGNKASARWDPRICISGLSYVRRFYSDRRIKGAFVRKGFKKWVENGFPRDSDTGLPLREYFENRGREEFVKVSWDEAFTIVAKALLDIVKNYSGSEGMKRLRRQGYDSAMVDYIEGAGTRTIKFRGGMPYISPMRIGAFYRFANMLALLDAWVRGVKPDEAKGGRGWDNYSWHTDLPPGHPMVCGNKTLDFDLYTAENAKLILLWGKNWISTKMPDGHWLTEAKLKGTKIVTIAPEYQSSSSKADIIVIIRAGTDHALALGLAHVILRDKLYDEIFIKSFTDLPLLVRMDTLKLLRARDVIPNYQPQNLKNYVKVIKPGDSIPPPSLQGEQLIPENLRNEWDDYVVWDLNTKSFKVVSRDHVGSYFKETGLDPSLEGEFEVNTIEGKAVKVRPIFDLIRQYVMDNFDPFTVSEITWAPVEAIEELANLIALNKGKTLFVEGMGPNHFFHSDLKDRGIILLASLTNNIGYFGGTVGSYAGNYRMEILNGILQWVYEDPFNPELDQDKIAKTKAYWKGESAHYYAYDDRPLRIGNKLFTGKTHMPSPTKACLWANSNSILGNCKWSHNVIVNTLPKIEMIVVNDWLWTATCEYADVVFGVDSWVERKFPDIYGSVTNPFLQAWVTTPLSRIFDTRDDMEVLAGIASKLSELTNEKRFKDYWHFVYEKKVEVYIERVLKSGNSTKGYTYEELEKSCKEGIPFFTMMRTSPRITGWEQTNESKPWYTKTGRLEFYREEDEFIEYGENLPVYREPIDSTFYEPNVKVAKPHPALKPKTPSEYNLDLGDFSTEVRQVRNIIKPWEEVKKTNHPLMEKGYTHILITPKYRHACHTTGASTDLEATYFGPFGDFYRHDKRKPWVSEGYIDINPMDAKKLGIEDGDYVWCEADPSDRPFVGWEKKPEDYKVFRWLVRARHYPNIAPGILRAWFHFYTATHGSVEAHEKRPDKLAKSERTGYQAAYRYGSHQSTTRTWLKPTLMTDSLVRKEYYGQLLGKGFALDVHIPVGAPKESFVKVTKAEDGGEEGKGLWSPAASGFRPSNPNDSMKRYLKGEYIEVL